METWRDIPGHFGQYQISTEGRVRNRRHRLLATFLDPPYMRVRLSGRNAGTYYVHQLMGITFLDTPHVIHINNIRADNRLENLYPR